MMLDTTITPQLQITPFTPTHQAEARNLILQGLGAHWGWIDEEINTDLEDISRSYSAGYFVLRWLDEVLEETGGEI